MKNRLFYVASLLLIITLLCCLTSCFERVEFSLEFVVDGETYATVKTGGEEVIKMPDDPEKEGYVFDGWYWDDGAYEEPFTANSFLDAPLSSNMRVYARWLAEECEHIAGDWIVDLEPDCKNDGARHNECTLCGETVDVEVLPKSLNHTSGDWITDVFPTCKNSGKKHKECTVCGEITSTGLIDKLSTHTESEWITDTEATCKDEGAKHTECTVCKKPLKTGTIEKTGEHTESGWITDTEATCKDEGAKHTECTVCKKPLKTDIIEKNDEHKYSSSSDLDCDVCGGVRESSCQHVKRTIAEIPATCTEPGWTKGVECSVCYEVLEAPTIVKAQGHKPSSEWTVEYWPTEYENGLKTKFCYICLETVESEIIPAEKECKLEWGIFDDYVVINGLGGFDETKLTIPDKIYGMKVKEISPYAFKDSAYIKSITIPNTVERIGDGAFEGCKALELINIPKSVTEIGTDIFKNTPKLLTLHYDSSYFSETNRFISSSNIASVTFGCETVPSLILDGAKRVKTIVLGNNVKKIGENAFSGTGISEIALPSTLTSIGDRAFYGCASLAAVSIPDSVTELGESAFAQCTSLASIILPKGLEKISDGLLMGCYSIFAVTIPDTVKVIGSQAFFNCLFTNIVIPEGVTLIGTRAFEACYNLKTVTLPSTLETVSFMAFYDCTGIKTVKYNGNREQFAAIGIANGNTALTGAELVTKE